MDAQIGKLIESGLERYGGGDLEGAMSEWKKALGLDPDNQRATDYLSYVAKHYQLSESKSQVSDSKAELEQSFGVEEFALAQSTSDDLDAYESFEVLAKDDDASEQTITAKSVKASSLDDGWTVDEGWVADLVSKSLSAFTPPPKQATAKGDADTTHQDGQAEVQEGDFGHDSTSAFAAFELDGGEESEESEEPTRQIDTSAFPAARAVLNLDLDAPFAEDESEQTMRGGSEDDHMELSLGTDARAVLDLDQPIEDTQSGVQRTIGKDFDDLELDRLDSVSDAIDSAPGGVSVSFRAPGLDLDSDEEPELQESDPDSEQELTQEHQAIPNFDEETTRRHRLADLDDEMTIDFGSEHGTSKWPRNVDGVRAPTSDPRISASSVMVDETLLSLEDSTRELDIRDVELPADDAETMDIGALDETSSGEDEEASSSLVASIMADAPTDDADKRATYIVRNLIKHAEKEFEDKKSQDAAAAIAKAMECASDCASAQKLVHEQEGLLIRILVASLGDLSRVLRLRVPLKEIPIVDLDHRAAFLLTRIDDSFSLDEILDVSGMQRLEALGHLSRLNQLGFVEVR